MKFGKQIYKTDKSIVQQVEITDKTYACKRINISNIPNVDRIVRELQIMYSIEHENLLTLHKYFVKKDEVMIIMDHHDMNLREFISPDGLEIHKSNGIVILATIFKKVITGIEYLHAKNIIHRDIKCSNILLNLDGSVLLSDYGVSYKTTKAQSFVGTPGWMSPEVCESGDLGYTKKTDIWSLGVSLIEAYVGESPYLDGSSCMKVILNICRDDPRIPKLVECEKQLYNLVKVCMKKDPERRKDAKDLLRLKIFKNVRDRMFLSRTFSAWNSFMERRYKDNFSIKSR